MRTPDHQRGQVPIAIDPDHGRARAEAVGKDHAHLPIAVADDVVVGDDQTVASVDRDQRADPSDAPFRSGTITRTTAGCAGSEGVDRPSAAVAQSASTMESEPFTLSRPAGGEQRRLKLQLGGFTRARAVLSGGAKTLAGWAIAA